MQCELHLYQSIITLLQNIYCIVPSKITIYLKSHSSQAYKFQTKIFSKQASQTTVDI